MAGRYKTRYQWWSMSNIGQSITRVQRLCGNHALATEDLILGFLNNRHSSILESFDWSRKKTAVSLTGVTDKSDGTLALTNGSPTVNGTATTFTVSDVGKYLTIGSDTSSLYVVKAVNTAHQFVLGDLNGSMLGWPDTSRTAQNYVMFKRLYSLGPGIEQIYFVKGKIELREVSEEYIDSIDPGRTGSAQDSYCYARCARDMSGSNDMVRIEMYPRPSQVQIITVSVLRGHVDLYPSQYPIVPSGPLEWFAAADVSYLLFARTKQEHWLALAAKYNEEAEKTLEREKNQDFKKFSQIQQVRDAQEDVPWSITDAGISHDYGD